MCCCSSVSRPSCARRPPCARRRHGNHEPETATSIGTRHAGVNTALAIRFADWLLSKPTQQRIGAFGRDAAVHLERISGLIIDAGALYRLELVEVAD